MDIDPDRAMQQDSGMHLREIRLHEALSSPTVDSGSEECVSPPQAADVDENMEGAIASRAGAEAAVVDHYYPVAGCQAARWGQETTMEEFRWSQAPG